jgi:hypothetical protein
VINAIIALYSLSTEENWPTAMFYMQDANDASTGPVYNGNYAISIYLLIFVFFSSSILVDMLVGVIFFEYQKV